jgi:hypothetical protein
MIDLEKDNATFVGAVPYLYLTGNMLFIASYQGDIVSWELHPEGKTLYRDIDATQEWLADGNAEKIGIQNIGRLLYFGDFAIDYFAPLSYKNWKNYIFPEGEFSVLKQMPGRYIGTDTKGLSYFLLAYPLGNITEAYTMDAFQFGLAILDTWTRKVYFRIYPKGVWDPPRRMDSSGSKYPDVIIIESWSVNPNGEVYFVDADKKKQEYQLKKLHNNWWEETGADKRKIARIEHNYTPLRTEAIIDSKNNGYNYEREFVWILDESKKTELIDGKNASWLRVRKMDGREGWILSSEVYYE